MGRLIATRVSDEQYSKIMGKCSGLGCSVYDYLKMLVESDMADSEKPKNVDQNEKLKRETDERLARIIEVLESLPA
jgi:hypothetical protein